ncbi:MAG: trpB [Sphingobacteriales bacterium]|nr:trpB [Sphingobacteriales bacterium]
MKIKVCGMKYPDNIRDLVLLNPDYIGFIFYDKSKRFVAEIDEQTIKDIPSCIKKTGVFVDENASVILDYIKKYHLQAVQLHGSETSDTCLKIAESGVEVIKAFGVDEAFDFNQLLPYLDSVNYFLFDTKTKAHGGSGLTFNWQVLEKYTFSKPYFLSGGLGLENLDKVLAINDDRLYAVDLNSCFESEPAKKDIEKLKLAINKLRPILKETESMSYNVNEKGYYGDFGGAYIPEMLYPNVEHLRKEYLKIIYEPKFQEEFNQLLKDYVGRPSPLFLAERLSAKYGAKIYLKREDLNHTGAHKINNTIGQILLAERLGKKRIIAETGAGQHGVATATVCALKGLECVVYMGEIDIERQAPNVARMKMMGATVVPAISGSKTLKDATNEAMRDWINNPEDTHYIIGSVVGPHPYPDMVARFQSIISEETKWQLKEKTGSEYPDYVLACVGGGSNAIGMFYNFLDDEHVKLIAVEAAGLGVDSGESAATTALGREGVLHGSRSILMQTEDGQVTEPYSISAGLDYPGIGPQHAHLFKTKRAQYVSITDQESLDAGLLLAQTEGIIPAIESAHALAYLEKMKFKGNETVVVCLSGRGDKDLATYMKYFNL